MLAVRASATRNAQRMARTFATVVDTSGIKVAAIDYNQPTSAVTVLVKAGSRYESKEGVAHALKNFAFKSTAKRSALGTVRESDLYGGVLSATLGREYLALTAEFLRGDEQFFVDVLSSFVTSAKYTRHEYQEYVAPLVEADVEAAASNPAVRAIEIAHLLAFRSGLGSSLFAPAHNSITEQDVKAFATSAFAKNNIAVIGSGISQAALSKLVEGTLASAPASAPFSSPASTYFGGETRLQGGSGLQTVFVGFGSTGAPSPELATLAAHLSTVPSVKWSQGLSPIAGAITNGISVQTVYLPYSDATLFGLLVQGSTPSSVKEAGKAAVKAMKAAAATIKPEELKAAAAKAKFAVASSIDTRDGLINTLGSKVLTQSDASSEALISAFDKVNVSGFSKATTALLSAKPTFVAIGEAQALPFADELGL